MPYRSIKPGSVIATIERLERRIVERFPNRGLTSVCAELRDVALQTTHAVARLRQPYLGVRVALAAVGVTGAALLIMLIRDVKWPALGEFFSSDQGRDGLFALFSGVEAAVNIVVLFGAGLFFLARHEERSKRAKALDDLYALRSLAHIIDMHQLTKDPTTLLAREQRTASSPDDTMTPFELVRYLDYCSEMLSLVAKCAALYAENVRDPVVLESVNDLEALTATLSRKIWQKISIVHQMEQPGNASPDYPAGPAGSV